MDHSLSDIVDPDFRPSRAKEPVFAFVHDFGSSDTGAALYAIGFATPTNQKPQSDSIVNVGSSPGSSSLSIPGSTDSVPTAISHSEMQTFTAETQSRSTDFATIYGSVTVQASYPMGSSTTTAINHAYGDTQ
ncbi:hypothetical protein M8818_003395 [Zalaria obscura]|uniref:Uncharacterized protein n=1 Tax=Zalaria obscura TaxID=2024903 RepID=A0ACC3SJE7_9PEZI